MSAHLHSDAPAGPGRTALAAVLLAVAMCWPLWLTAQVYVFHDTPGYLATGDKILALLKRMLALANATGAAGGAGGTAPQDGLFLRSFGYATFAASTTTAGGPLLLALAQGSMVLFATLALVPGALLRPMALLLALPLATTTLPWFTVFAMPDLFTAVVIVFGALLWRRFDDLGRLHQILLVALAGFACLMHYGNPPLAFGLYTLVLLGRALHRRLTPAVVLAAVVPVLAGPVLNLAASTAVLDSPSTAPKRLPVLLARSIEDGPAAWYLRETCAGPNDLAICAAFDGEVPDDITAFLWSPRGIRSLTPQELEAVRAEEGRILRAAFRAYPLAQTRSLTRNAWKQFHSVGLAKIEAAPDLRATKAAPAQSPGARLVAFFDPVMDWTTLAGALALLPLTFVNRQQFAPVFIIVAGLALNAAIFGGLSAPDDRYQARVVWILPFLALTYGTMVMSRWLSMRATAH